MKKVAALVLALGMLAALCACGGESDKKTILRLNEVTHSVFYAPQYVAMSQGFFADEGLEIELTNGGGADKGSHVGGHLRPVGHRPGGGRRPASTSIIRVRTTIRASSPS